MARSWMVVAAGLWACGNGGSSGSATFSTSVSGSAKLSELSSTQLTQLCNDLQAFTETSPVYADAVEAGCRLAATFAAELGNPQSDGALQQACMTAYNSCKSDSGKVGSVSTQDLACNAQPTTCTATVAEMTACLNDYFAELDKVFKGLPTCSQLTRAGLADGGPSFTIAEPASCQTLDTKCPSPTKK